MFSADSIERHLFVSKKYSKELKTLTELFFNQTSIKYFSYNRFYNQQKWIGLYTETHPVESTLKNGIGPFFLDLNGVNLQPGVYFHEDIKDQLKTKVLTSHVDDFFNQDDCIDKKKVVTNGLLIIRKGHFYHESFYFSLLDLNINGRLVYEKSIEFIKAFCHFFLYKGRSLISLAENKKISYFLPAKNLSQLNYCNTNTLIFNNNSKLKYCFPTSMGDIYLSQQELNCLRLLVKGLPVVEISYLLNIKNSTAISYIKNLKLKLNIDAKKDLISIYSTFSPLDQL